MIVLTGVAVDQVLKGGWTCLLFASSSGQPQVVDYVLQQGANPNMHKGEWTQPQFLETNNYNTDMPNYLKSSLCFLSTSVLDYEKCQDITWALMGTTVDKCMPMPAHTTPQLTHSQMVLLNLPRHK